MAAANTTSPSPPPTPPPPIPSRWRKLATGLLVAFCLISAAAVGGSFVQGGLASVLFSHTLTPDAKLNHLKDFFCSLGTAAPATYVLLTTVEVVIAPLPGIMLYAPGGVIFGGFWGGFLSLIGNILGAGIACQLMRSLGDGWGNRLARKRTLHDLQKRLTRHGLWVVFLLRLNPLTSSDLVSYAAGLTRIPTWKVCLGTALGMAPLCWAQAYAADELLHTFPKLLYPLVILCGIYAVIATALLWRALRAPPDPPANGLSTPLREPPR